ncbi:class I SAM-dependent methyltransferase [Hanstruepera flava]|uniref:class I SAM-dependent methyltransferase n=1 Tax=Hanstruepera flava TaxID=2930218 RepID=UPI0020279D65|nr:class I SAM-dependent methyltransferase [Hanstruepera flava]
MNFESHWNKAFEKEDSQLGWFEENPAQTMQLVTSCNLEQDSRILTVGAGTTTLIDNLLDAGFQNIFANDLSTVALNKLKLRIQGTYQYDLTCIADDLTNPTKLKELKPVDLWIDRAVLHFFLKPEEQESYFNLLTTKVSQNGYALIAVFATNGAEKCCGLPLQRYSLEMLQEKLGKDFKLVDSFNYTFINPFGGERPYIYTLFKKA